MMQPNVTDPRDEIEVIQEARPRPLVLADYSANLEMAIDTLAAMLREYGKYAFDTPEAEAEATRDLCDKWAMHVLNATPRPGEDTLPDALAGGKRDWAGLRAYFSQHRRQEGDYATQTLSDMRQVIWTFIGELNRSLLGDQNADNRMKAQLERLKTAVDSSSMEEIRREVLSAVSAVTRVMEEREQQQRHLMQDLYARIQELGAQLEEARQESALDPLTRLYNRKAFDTQLARSLDLHAVFEQPTCLLLADADHFKSINDRFGHTVGDAVLKELANCLTRTFVSKGDCVARYGGEEFAIVLRDVSLADGRRHAARLLDAVRRLRIRYKEGELSITISLGLSEARPTDTSASWVERADAALYRAKQNGRNRLEAA